MVSLGLSCALTRPVASCFFRFNYFALGPMIVDTSSLKSAFGKIRTGSLAITVMLLAIGGDAVLQTTAHSGGMTGLTQKSSSSGCSCHCPTSSSATTVTIADSLGTGALTVGPS